MHVSTVQAATLQAPPSQQQHPSQQQPRTHTLGKVNYVDRPKTTDPLYLNVYSNEEHPSNLSLTESDVTVHDVRPVQSELSLERNGFVLRKLEVPAINWDNKVEVRAQEHLTLLWAASYEFIATHQVMALGLLNFKVEQLKSVP